MNSNEDTLKLKQEIDNLRNELYNLLKSDEIDIDLTLELSMELDLVINNFNKSLDFYYKLA